MIDDTVAMTCEKCGHTTQMRLPQRYEPLPSDADIAERNIKIMLEALRYAMQHWKTHDDSRAMLELIQGRS